METVKDTPIRRWRKGGKRGVSPIIATILLVAITVVLAAVLYILISGLTKGPGNTPIGTAVSYGSVFEQTASASTFWYNTSVQTAPSGMTWSNMIFQVQGSGNNIITTGPSTITVLGTTNGCNLAVFTFSTAAWTIPAANKCTGQLGASGGVAAGDQMVLFSTVSLTNVGDKLVVVGQGSYSGSLSISIP